MLDPSKLDLVRQQFTQSLPLDLSLVGKHAALEPLCSDHVEELGLAASDGELWNLAFTSVPTVEGCADFVQTAIANRDKGKQRPFAIRRLADNKIVGSTRYYVISPENLNLSIGYTWISKSAQRSAINTECKLMLLTHAFEQAACISVQWHTHHDNLVSQTAIERLGALKDGVLRNHLVLPDGSIRHTHCYSMIRDEWPTAKAKLLSRLGQG